MKITVRACINGKYVDIEIDAMPEEDLPEEEPMEEEIFP